LLVADRFASATVNFVFISRRYAGKVSIKRDTQEFYEGPSAPRQVSGLEASGAAAPPTSLVPRNWIHTLQHPISAAAAADYEFSNCDKSPMHSLREAVVGSLLASRLLGTNPYLLVTLKATLSWPRPSSPYMRSEIASAGRAAIAAHTMRASLVLNALSSDDNFVASSSNADNGQTKLTFVGNETMEDAKESGQLEGWNQVLDKLVAVLTDLAQAK
jgi:hypothetical protein